MLGTFDHRSFYFITVFLFYQHSTQLLVFFCDDEYKLFLISNQVAKGLHGILSPHEDGGVSFFRTSGSLPFPVDSGQTSSFGGSHN